MLFSIWLGPMFPIAFGRAVTFSADLHVIGPSRISRLRGWSMEYSVTVWRTPIGEWKETLFRLTFRREWVEELGCWRDVVVGQERLRGSATG
jgi:hypothetical protein